MKLKEETKWWTIIVSILEVNISDLGFYVAVQFLLPSFFAFENKINFGVTTAALFFILLYSLSFYPVISCLDAKSAGILLQRCD